jgi:CheY-like chemotaxis protein
VDDNAASRALLMELLEFWKCDAEAVASPWVVPQRLETEASYDAVLVDLEMPRFRGDRLAALLHEHPRSKPTPLVLMTPQGCRESPDHWRTIGFSAQISKPVKQGELAACLATLMDYGPAPAPAASIAPAEPRISRELKSKFRLLVVEDNLVNQEVALGILERLGYQAGVADNGASALQALGEKNFDLVLMDCQMPEMDGYEATRLIREPATPVRNHSIPIIAMTAHAMPGDREKCLEAGMDDYLTKPIEPLLLDRMIECWLAGRAPQTRAPAAVPAREPQSGPPVFDRDGLLERLMGDSYLAQRVIDAFVTTIPSQIAALAQAVSDADAATAGRAAHSIKGAAANAGGQELSEAAKRAEKLGRTGDLEGLAAMLPELEKQLDRLRLELTRFCEQLNGPGAAR